MIKLSECDLHDIGHARWQVDRATDEKPEVCFDYTLVANLLRIIDRLTAAAKTVIAPCDDAEFGTYDHNAAAEVGPKERWGTNLVEYAAYRHGLAEMKERCARAADHYAKSSIWQAADMAETIAAAIRAMEDSGEAHER